MKIVAALLLLIPIPAHQHHPRATRHYAPQALPTAPTGLPRGEAGRPVGTAALPVIPDARSRVTGRAATRTRRLPPVVHGTLLDWHALAVCESSDNPRSVSSSGKYRGLYQFDITTWRTVGGTGDPAEATRTEQTLRAALLYQARGRSPWPVCGRHL